MKTFTKTYNYLYDFNEITNNEITLLSFIISHIENNQEFFYTDEQISNNFNKKLGDVRTIGRLIKSLKENEFIITSTSKKIYPDKKWGNRRIIVLGPKLNDELPSTEKEEIIEEIIPQPIQNIQEDIKVPEIEEKQYDDSFFPDFLKQETYTEEEYTQAVEYINSNIYNYKPTPKKIHQDNILNNIEL
jgi:hypothetical protein